MAWIIILDDFDWCPSDRETTAYKASANRQQVKEDCATWAIANGVARRAKTPTRAERVGDGAA